MQRFSMCLAMLCVMVLAPLAPADDWPHWRGEHNTGYVADANPPVEFSATLNVRWKIAIPGAGHGSPIVLGDHVYLMAATDTDMLIPPDPDDTPDPDAPEWLPVKPQMVSAFVVLAIDRHTGEIVWQKTMREEQPHEGGHPTNTFSSASVVTDGERLFANFGSRGIYCLSLDGEKLWETDLGEMDTRNHWGEGATPALRDGILVVPWDHEGDSMVVAFEAATGCELWRVDRDELTTWCTPVITDVGGRAQVILSGNNTCLGYDLKTGDEIWRCRGLSLNVTPSPIVGHGMVYLMSGYRGSVLLAVKLDEAKGDITDSSAIAWRHGRATPYIPSGMLAGRNLYFLGSNNGRLSCVDAVTGEAHYLGERLGAVQNVYASIVGAGDHFYVCGREGNVAVLKEGSTLEIIARNNLGEGINASPAIVGDTLYIRGDEHLFCIER